MEKIIFHQIRNIFLAFSICLILLPMALRAQTANITLDMKNVPLEEVMNEIKKQTRYLFINQNVEDITRRVSIRVENCPVSETLNKLFAGSDIDYKIQQTNIIIFQKKTKSPAASGPVTVSGVVRDAAGNPVIGAAVIVKGTTVGTSTGIDGDYVLQIPAPEAGDPVLAVNYLGYQPEEFRLDGRTRLDFTLREEAQSLDAVVVTALGIKRSEKALSYNVQQVSSESITSNKDVNFINSLSGKVAGVTINASSSGVGGASKVIMRGQKSISQSSNALYVIDGVPMFTTARDGGTEFSSQGSTDPIADINPEDIESISVLTGAAAAALYGSDAANGAIVVTTKHGQAGQLSVNVASSVEVM